MKKAVAWLLAVFFGLTSLGGLLRLFSGEWENPTEDGVFLLFTLSASLACIAHAKKDAVAAAIRKSLYFATGCFFALLLAVMEW